MSRNQVGQPQRSVNNPLVLGTFSETSLRYLKGSLGPVSKPIGRADTNQLSNGGFGGGTYNHWFQINLASPAWIIVTKGPPRPKYINTSVYELDKNPIQGHGIFQGDSIVITVDGRLSKPYLDTVMSAQSDLTNQFDRGRLGDGDERYEALSVGAYLLCVSSTRNEPLDYAVGIVIQFPDSEPLITLEDDDNSLLITEDDFAIIVEIGNPELYSSFQDHSLLEWQNAWEREHQDTDRFPEIFIPLTNKP